MANAEMILKIVMSPIESPSDFVKQCNIRLPDLQFSEFQKILDMKVIIMAIIKTISVTISLIEYLMRSIF